MKVHKLTLLLALWAVCSIGATANNNVPIYISVEGKKVRVTQCVEGPFKLYESFESVTTAQEATIEAFRLETTVVITYYLEADGQLHEINNSNYKRQIKKLLPKAPDLHKSLGKLGFRFENVPQMIGFYNQFRV